MNLREQVRGCVALTGVLLAACGHDSAPPQSSAKPPNVLIVLLDTLRPDHLPFQGSLRDTAPRLTALARDSIVFDDAQSAAPLTVASLLTLMTSLYPEVHQVQGTLNPGRMSENVTTLAEVLAAHGYATAAFTEGGYANPDFGLGQGFQTYPRHPEDRSPNVSELLGESRLASNVERTIEWLKQPRTQPFFLFFHTYEIHAPYRTRAENVRLFRPGYDEVAQHTRAAEVIERWNKERKASADDCLQLLAQLYEGTYSGLPALQDPDGFARVAHEYHCAPEDAVDNPGLLSIVRDLYDASIVTTDHELERLWTALDQLGIGKDTLIVVASDHGEGLGQHHEMEHSNVLFGEALRVLLMIRPPRALADVLTARHVSERVRTVDLMPTVLELLGIDSSHLLLQGKSLVPLMRGEKESERVAFSHARRVTTEQNPQYTVREGDWRLITEPKAKRVWLYDCAHDPGELVDVAAQHADVVERLSALLAKQAEQDRWLREKIKTTPRTLEIDEPTMRELRNLGYTDSDKEKTPGARKK